MIFRLVFSLIFLSSACILSRLGVAVADDSAMPVELAFIARLCMGGALLAIAYGFAYDIKEEVFWRRRFGTNFLPFWLSARTRQPMRKYK